MAVCPKCKKVINELSHRVSGISTSRFFINDEGDFDEDEEDFDSDGWDSEYSCPKCWEVLFEDYSDAQDFLIEKDELKEVVAEKITKIKQNDNNN